jgi:hypothetical protein
MAPCEIKIDNKCYYGKTEIVNNRTAEEQIHKRFVEHASGNLRIDKKIREVGQDNCQLTLMHEGLYGSNHALSRDEIALIQAFKPAELLNEKDVIAQAAQRQGDDFQKECKVPHTARLVLDAQLPRLLCVGRDNRRVSLRYYANGKRTTIEGIGRNGSKKAPWNVKQVEKLMAKYWKAVNKHYSRNSLMNPFTGLNEASKHLHTFVKDTLQLDVPGIGIDVSGGGSSRADQSGIRVNCRAAKQMKKRKGNTRNMLANKRRREE